MAKFDAAVEVERLEYDFTSYGGGSGYIDEPSTKRVSEFFRSMQQMFKDVKALQKATEGIEESADEMSAEEAMEAVDKVDEASAGAEEFQSRMTENLAILCGAEWEEVVSHGSDTPDRRYLMGGSPTHAEIEALPYRVLQAFSRWLMGEIRPKGTTPDTRPSPQDRKRRTT